MNKFQILLIGIIIALVMTLIQLNSITKKYEQQQLKNHIEFLILEDNVGVVPEQEDIQ